MTDYTDNHRLQLAIECVRAEALAMRHSDDLQKVVAVLYREMRQLGIHNVGCGINFIDEQSEQYVLYLAFDNPRQYGDVTLPSHIIEISEKVIVTVHATDYLSEETRKSAQNWRAGKVWHSDHTFCPEESLKDALDLPDDLPAAYLQQWAGQAHFVEVPFKEGFIGYEQRADDPANEAIVQQLAAGLSLGYARFLDLQRLEAQNRELKIQNALERVRSQALSMQTTDDLPSVSAALFREIGAMDFPVETSLIGVIDKKRDLVHQWTTLTQVNEKTSKVGTVFDENPRIVLEAYPFSKLFQMAYWWGESYRTWQRDGTSYFAHQSSNEELLHVLKEFVNAGIWDEEIAAYTRQQYNGKGLRQVIIFYKHGYVVWNLGERSLSPFEGEAAQRFTEVFSFAYDRFLELQEKEQNAHQAHLEAAAERVRTAAMEMNSAAEIRRVVGVVRHELVGLGFPERFPTVINYIDDKAEDLLYAYFAFPNPRQIGLNWTSPDLWELDEKNVASVKIWKENEVGRDWITSKEILREDQSDAAIVAPYSILEAFGIDPEFEQIFEIGTHITGIPFTYGQIAVRDNTFLTDDQIGIVRALCDALSLGFTRFQDFQRLEEQNRALEQANDQIQQATQRKSQFLASMSHDLRTPMNAIIGYTRILQRRGKDALEPRLYRNLENIETSSNNLLELINGILDLSRIESGRLDIKPAQVDLKQLAQECAASVAPLLRDGVELQQTLAEVPTLHTDGELLRRVLVNLLGNAAKFTESGGITLTMHLVKEAIELTVADTGVGIPPEDLPYIFEEFRQVDRDGAEAQGSGLGLAIVKKTVELLGGTIVAESTVCEGTTFILNIADYHKKSDTP